MKNYVIEPDFRNNMTRLVYGNDCRTMEEMFAMNETFKQDFYTCDVNDPVHMIEVKFINESNKSLTGEYKIAFDRIAKFKNLSYIVVNNYYIDKSFFSSHYYNFFINQFQFLTLLDNNLFAVEICDFLTEEYIYNDHERKNIMTFLNSQNRIEKHITRNFRLK